MAGRAQPLRERETEVSSLHSLVRSAREGDGRVSLITGVAGIGKSALVAETKALAAEEGVRVLAARGAELEREFPFGIVRQLFEPALAQLSQAERDELFAGAAALADRVLGGRQGPSTDGPEQLAALHGLYWLCVNLAESRPILLAVDDAHWGDVASLRWLAYLAPRLAGVPAALVVAARPGAPEPAGPLIDGLGGDPDADLLEPDPLSSDGLRTLLADAFSAPIDDEFARAFHEQTSGNPLLARELAAALIADGVLPDAAAARTLAARPPRDALRSVLTRIGRLPDGAAALARAVAVLDTDVELRDAGALAGLEYEAAADAADRLTEAGIIAPGRPLQFAHPLLRRAVYEDIPAARRATQHRRAAELLRADPAAAARVAAHLIAGEPTGAPWAIEHLRGAATAARASGAPESAVALLVRCLAERPPPDTRAMILHELGVAELRIGAPTALERLTDAHATARDELERVRIAHDLAPALLLNGRIPDAYDLLERTADAIPPGNRELALLNEAKLISFGMAGPGLADRVRSRVVRVPPLAGDTPGERRLLASVARHMELTCEPAAAAADLAERAISTDEVARATDPDDLQYVLAIAPLILAGRLSAARDICHRAIRQATERGALLSLSYISILLSFVEFEGGNLAAAENAGATGLDLSRRIGLVPGIAAAVPALVRVAIERGELELADGLLREHHLDGDIPELFVFFNIALTARGTLRLAQGRADEGIDDLLEAGARDAAAGKIGNGPILWRSAVVPALAHAGRHDLATELITRELELGRRTGSALVVGPALRARGQLERGEAAIRTLREAAEVSQDTDFKLEHARALTELGAALRRDRRRADAREPLRLAVDIAHRCGATVLAERAGQELLATGARPRRFVLTGIESLTVSERRVAELAAQGLTNKQIAQSLFVTHRTVATHLAHCYEKLGIRSRSELAARLESN